MPTLEEYRENAERMRQKLKRAFGGWDAMYEMDWRHRKQLVDMMFEGEDGEGRKFGIYLKQLGPKVYDYEIYGKFSQGARFLKEFDDDYFGPETASTQSVWGGPIGGGKNACTAAKRKNMQVSNGELPWE